MLYDNFKLKPKGNIVLFNLLSKRLILRNSILLIVSQQTDYLPNYRLRNLFNSAFKAGINSYSFSG